MPLSFVSYDSRGKATSDCGEKKRFPSLCSLVGTEAFLFAVLPPFPCGFVAYSACLEAPSRARPRAAPGAVAAVIFSRSSTRCRRPLTPSTPGVSFRACTSRLSRPDEVVCLVSARPHVLLHLDYRHPFVAILVALGRGAFGCVCHGSSNLPVRHRAGAPHGTMCLFVCATIEPPDAD